MRSAIGTTLVLGAVVGLAAQTREPRGGGVFSPDYDYNITGRWTFSSLPTVTGSSLVTGPTSSTDDAIVRFSGTTGAVIQGYTSNAPTISDSGEPYFRGQATFKAAHSFDSSILFTSLGAASDVAPQSMRWIQTDLAMPYGLGTYVNNTGAFYTGKFITISNKRVDVNGAIMGVSATSDGQEGTMLSITPDINGPALGIEASGAPTGSLKDQAAIAFYDLDTGIGGNTPYSSGYHAKKSMVSGNGTWSWGANLSTDPNANYETRLAPNFVSASAKGLLLTANAIGFLGAGQVASSEDASFALDRLATHAERRGRAERLTILALLRTTKTLTSGTRDYTIGSGGAINIVRPVWIDHATIILDNTATDHLELPIRIFTDAEWANLGLKTYDSASIEGIYYDHAFSTSTSRGTISTYPTINISHGDAGALHAAGDGGLYGPHRRSDVRTGL
jgi:hypothetical protein